MDTTSTDTRRHAVDLQAEAPTTSPRPRRGRDAAAAADVKRAARAHVLRELADVNRRLRADLGALRGLGFVATAAAACDPSRPWVRTSGRRNLTTARRVARGWARLLAEHDRLTREAARLKVCDAKCRDGHPCCAPGLGRGGRCRRHGGASTGATTPEGAARALSTLRRHQPRPDAPKRKPVVPIVDRYRAALAELLARRPARRKPRTSTFTASAAAPASPPGAIAARCAARILAAHRAEQPSR